MRPIPGLILAAILGAVILEMAAAEQAGEESPSAKATRKKLLQTITLDAKEVGIKDITDDIKRELDKPVSFKIDNVSGISNNSKVTYSCKDKTLAQVLNDLADKYEFGWYVVSNPKDRLDGWIMIRKHKEKERGYEAGKEPKKR